MLSEVPVLFRKPGQGAALAFGGQPVLCLAVGSETNEQHGVLKIQIPPGAGPPPHVHSREEEGFYLLRGEITFTAGNQTTTVGPGSFVNLSIGTAHTLVSSGSEMAEYLLVVAPAGFERFVGEAGTPLPTLHSPIPLPAPGDLERLLAAAERFGLSLQPSAELFQIAPKMHVCRPDDAVALTVGGETYSILCDGDATGGRYALVEIALPPGSGPPPHKHTRATEAFYVLEGSVEFQVQGQSDRFLAEPGAFVQVPAGFVQQFRAVGPEVARIVALLSPAGPEQFFREAVGVDLPALHAAAERYGIELLAEVPE